MKKNKLFLVLAASFLSTQVMAANPTETSLIDKAKNMFETTIEQTKGLTTKVIGGVKQEKVKEALNLMQIPENDYEILTNSSIKGAVEVKIKSVGGQLFFFEDGSKFLTGKLYQVENGKIVDPVQQKSFAKLKDFEKEMIVYKADNEKHVVTAFVDITCHYCHLLHQNIKKYNDLGITIRYLAFPREGLNGKIAMQMESIFTSNNPKQAMDDAENGKTPTIMKEPNIVKKHYEFGNEYGVSGTPALITSKGDLIPGYLEPTELLKHLEKNK